MNLSFIKILKESDLPLEKLKNANILITGANGLIASNLAEALVLVSRNMGLNLQLYLLCRNEKKALARFEKIDTEQDIHYLIQDVSEPLKSDVCFDIIFHAASSAHPGAFNTVPVDVMKANFIGTLNLLEYCRNTNTRFVFVSSSEIYGENLQGIDMFSEDTLGNVNCTTFRSCYPESKRASETLCESYRKQYGTDVIIVRPAYIYGKEVISSNVRADAYFMRQALEHQDIVMYSEGKQIRSYCYVNDCVSGMLYAALKGNSGEAYNIGNDRSIITLHDYAKMLADYAGVKLIYEPKSEPMGVTFLKTTRCVLDCTKLKKLGWSIRYELMDGIKEIFSES